MLLDGWINTRLFRDAGHLLDAAYKIIRSLDPAVQVEKPDRKPSVCVQLRMIDWDHFDGAQMRKILDFLGLRICDLADDLGVTRKTISFWLAGTPPQASAIAALKLLLLAHRHNLLAEFRGQLAATKKRKTG